MGQPNKEETSSSSSKKKQSGTDYQTIISVLIILFSADSQTPSRVPWNLYKDLSSIFDDDVRDIFFLVACTRLFKSLDGFVGLSVLLFLSLFIFKHATQLVLPCIRPCFILGYFP